MFKINLPQFKDLFSDMKKANKDIERFIFSFNNIMFDAIIDISTSPFELMVGAIGTKQHWACIMYMEKGYRIGMEDYDFFSLCELLDLQPGKKSFTSSVFLKYLAEKAPKKCKNGLIDPRHLSRYRKNKIKKDDEPEKDIFLGWNDHIKDKRRAHNFDKTQQYFGKKCADYCRLHNISSLWTNDVSKYRKPYQPWE